MTILTAILAAIRRAWCRSAHSHIMLPVNGVYRCASCLEAYDVPWGESGVSGLDARNARNRTVAVRAAYNDTQSSAAAASSTAALPMEVR